MCTLFRAQYTHHQPYISSENTTLSPQGLYYQREYYVEKPMDRVRTFADKASFSKVDSHQRRSIDRYHVYRICQGANHQLYLIVLQKRPKKQISYVYSRITQVLYTARQKLFCSSTLPSIRVVNRPSGTAS